MHPAFDAAVNVGCFLGVPLVLSDGTIYGTLCAVDPDPQVLTHAHVDLLLVLGKLLVTYIERDRALALNVQLVEEMTFLLERERATSAALAAATARAQLLADVRDHLLHSLDYSTTLSQITTRLTPEMADWSMVYVMEQGEQPPTVHIATDDPQVRAVNEMLLQRFPPDRQPAHSVLGQVLQAGASMYLPAIDDTLLADIAIDDEHLALLHSLSMRALLAVPLRIHDTVLGFLLLGIGSSGHIFSSDDVRLAEQIAAHAAQAITHARLYHAEQQAVQEKTSALALLNTLVATAPFGLAFQDRDLRYRLVNDHLAALNGRPAAAHIGRTIDEIVPQLAGEITPLMQQVLATGQSIMDRHVTGDATQGHDEQRFWRVSYYPVPDGTGGIQGVGTVVLDVTQEQRMTAAIRDSEERFRLLVDGVKDYAIFMLDPGGHVLSWNKGAEAIHGYRADEIVGRHVGCFYLPADRARHKPEHQITIASLNGRYEEEGWRVRKDGSHFWAHVIVTVVYTDTGTLKGFAKITRDMTERRLAERERERCLAQEQAARIAAETAVQARETFLSIAAHELKTPLTTLLGHTFLLQHTRLANGLSDIQHGSVQAINQQARRLHALIDTVLDVTRSQHGQLQIERQPLDMTDLVRQVADEVRPMLERHTLEVNFPSSAVVVLGDEIRLTQVLNNLLSNAIKYSPLGGQVDVTLGYDGEWVELAVRDCGLGIPEHAQAQLFQPFFRASNIDPKKISGFGLGLHLVHDIVTLHGGSVAVESREGDGSRFVVRLPRSE